MATILDQFSGNSSEVMVCLLNPVLSSISLPLCKYHWAQFCVHQNLCVARLSGDIGEKLYVTSIPTGYMTLPTERMIYPAASTALYAICLTSWTTLISGSAGIYTWVFNLRSYLQDHSRTFLWSFRVTHGMSYHLLTFYSNHPFYFINCNASFMFYVAYVLLHALGFGVIS